MQILSNEPPPKHEKEQMLLYQPTVKQHLHYMKMY